MSKTKPHENPLVPNKKLRQIYTTMAEVRVLDEFAARIASKAKARFHSSRGEEACRVSTAIGLGEGDIVSDSQNGVVMDLIAGRSARYLQHRLNTILSGEKRRQAGHKRTSALQLPWIKDATARMTMALGAAASLKSSGRENLVMAYVQGGELSDAIWRHVLRLAAELELPIIFIALPDKVGKRNLCAKAQTCGLPGFPVDATDAVAIYRVAQESIGRARSDGGPVLIECLARPLSSQQRSHKDDGDPIALMRAFMLGRKVANKTWLDNAGRSFRRQLETGLHISGNMKNHIQR